MVFDALTTLKCPFISIVIYLKNQWIKRFTDQRIKSVKRD